jgi:hypothetical protein
MKKGCTREAQGCTREAHVRCCYQKLLVWLERTYGAVAKENHDYKKKCLWCCCDRGTSMTATGRSYIATAEDDVA